LNANLLNPFISSLDQAIMSFSGFHIKKQKVEILTNALNHGANIHVFLGVTGDFYGNVLLSADHKSGLQLASMMVGESLETFNDMSVSALQELLNITSGNAVTQLAEMGIKADISPPAFLTGLQLDIRVLFPLISVLLSAGETEFYLNLSLKTK
jgi:chemotaxis protein CheX